MQGGRAMIILKNTKEKTLPTQNVGQGGMWPHHRGVHVIVGILILVVPVPISTLQGVITISFFSPSLLLFMVPQVVLWSGLVFVLAIILWLSLFSHSPPLCEQSLRAAVVGAGSC